MGNIEDAIEAFRQSISELRGNEPMDGDLTELIANRIKAELDFKEGNITEDEYKKFMSEYRRQIVMATDTKTKNIEDTIFDRQLPVNSIAVLNRIAEILKEHETNNVNSTSGDIRLRCAMWLLNAMYYGQTAIIDMSREWQTLYDLKKWVNKENFEIFVEDLKPETAQKLLDFLDIECPEEGNYDVVPIATIPKPEKEQEEPCQ